MYFVLLYFVICLFYCLCYLFSFIIYYLLLFVALCCLLLFVVLLSLLFVVFYYFLLSLFFYNISLTFFSFFIRTILYSKQRPHSFSPLLILSVNTIHLDMQLAVNKVAYTYLDFNSANLMCEHISPTVLTGLLTNNCADLLTDNCSNYFSIFYNQLFRYV